MSTDEQFAFYHRYYNSPRRIMEWPQRAPQRRQRKQSLPRRRLHLPSLHQSRQRRRLVPPSPPRQRPELLSLLRPQQRSQLPRQRSSRSTTLATKTRTAEFSPRNSRPFFYASILICQPHALCRVAARAIFLRRGTSGEWRAVNLRACRLGPHL